jgi:predicted transposase/invertase (TIGR01784 family)
VEVFFYRTPHAYSNLFAKVFLWLETKNPAQNWHACIIFAHRRLEPRETLPYAALLGSKQVTRVYLDELPRGGDDQLGLGILRMIASSPTQALADAKKWLTRVGDWKKPVPIRRKAVELIELAVLGHFPSLGRKELEDMLQIRDFRETKVYREAREEGLEEGLEKGLEEGRREIALRLLAKKHSVAEVAELTGLSVQRVRALKKRSGSRD